jgi:hypothetical protein
MLFQNIETIADFLGLNHYAVHNSGMNKACAKKVLHVSSLVVNYCFRWIRISDTSLITLDEQVCQIHVEVK